MTIPKQKQNSKLQLEMNSMITYQMYLSQQLWVMRSLARFGKCCLTTWRLECLNYCIQLPLMDSTSTSFTGHASLMNMSISSHYWLSKQQRTKFSELLLMTCSRKLRNLTTLALQSASSLVLSLSQKYMEIKVWILDTSWENRNTSLLEGKGKAKFYLNFLL